MKTAIRIAALIAGLFPVIATAQVNLLNVPSGTVVGRTTIGPGPAQVIPFDRFVSSITQSASPTIGSTLIPLGQTTTEIDGLTLGNPTINGATLSGTFLGSVLNNGNFVNAPATTVKCNPTASSAQVQDCSTPSVTGNFLPTLVGDGTTDNCSAIGALNTAIAALPSASYDVKLTPGTYVVNCNVTLSGVWYFMKGAILKPGNGFAITFANMPIAGAWQIFNLYTASTGTVTGGNVVFPGLNGITDVWGEWFGMVGDAATLHNEVGMQFAINTVHPTSSSNGGFVRVGTGTFLTCAHYEVTNLVTIKGMGNRSSELLASSSCWTTDINMVLSVNPVGNHAQFGCWHEDIQINAGAIPAITRVINAGSWQEDSGLKRVLLANFMQIGIIDTDFYGGAASFNLEDVEIFSSASATGTIVGLLMQSPGTQDWTNVNLNRVTFATGRATPLGNETGFQFFGRVNVNVTGIHFEQAFVGFDLNDRANLTGSGVNSGNNVTTVVQISAFGNPQNGNEANLPGSSGVTQMSRVALQGFLLGGATTLFHDAVNSVTTTDQFAMPFNYGP